MTQITLIQHILPDALSRVTARWSGTPKRTTRADNVFIIKANAKKNECQFYTTQDLQCS